MDLSTIIYQLEECPVHDTIRIDDGEQKTGVIVMRDWKECLKMEGNGERYGRSGV